MQKFPVKDCQTRWNSLRDRFTKEKRRLEQLRRNGAEATSATVWEYYEGMEFLQKFVKHRM